MNEFTVFIVTLTKAPLDQFRLALTDEFDSVKPGHGAKDSKSKSTFIDTDAKSNSVGYVLAAVVECKGASSIFDTLKKMRTALEKRGVEYLAIGCNFNSELAIFGGNIVNGSTRPSLPYRDLP